MVHSLRDQWQALIDPWELCFLFASAFFRTLLQAIMSFDILLLFSPTKLRDRGFANAFINVKQGFKTYEAQTEVPALVAAASGRVLELGPGIGNQCEYFDASKVKHIFGVEPNLAMLPQLHAEVQKLGLSEKYTVVPCGMEDHAALDAAGIKDGSIDCVLSLQVLCTVPQPRQTVEKIYRLLKPGGKLLMWEHVACKDPLHRAMQWLWSPFWSFALCGCTVGRQIDDWVIQAGEWDDIKLEWTPENGNLFPRVGGYLVKAKK